ncbi:MAG: O-methyltransferase [Acidobacteria bacterium]|nr:O-methyltransferase [Acidobacteriota bacterium]MBI3264124.1 O-methyltransferase [Acidobacteriota bacterium]
MSQIVPGPIESYLSGLSRAPDEVLQAVARQGEELGLPIVSRELGELLHLLVGAIAARRVLEIGTAVGYSTLWMARALPADGMIITMEVDESRAAAARQNLADAGVADRVSVMVGDSARLVTKVSGPFDLIFQDGDKQQYESLLDPLADRLRPGGLLVTDNVLWNGEVVPGFVTQATRNHAHTVALRRYNQRLASDRRFLSVFLPVGDGVALAMKTAES